MSGTSQNERINILYVEDYPDIREKWARYLRTNRSDEVAKVVDVASYEEAYDELQAGFKPDLALLDRSILKWRTDRSHSPDAGDDLYRLLLDHEVPVILISGHQDQIMGVEPYCSDPPIATEDKPVTEGTFERALAAYRTYVGG